MSNPWFRYYNKTFHSRKVQQLSDRMFRAWVNLLSFVNEETGDGSLPSLEDIAYAFRMSVKEAGEMLRDLTSAGLMEQRDGGLWMHDWSVWQPPSDSSAARAKRYRDKKRRVTSPSRDRHVASRSGANGRHDHPVTARRALEGELEGEGEEEGGTRPPASPREGARAREGVPPREEPFEPSEPIEFPPPPPFLKEFTPEETEIVARATSRWGASNGDAVVGDLLREYPPAWVRAACDREWEKHQQNLHVSYLRAILQGYVSTNGPPPDVKPKFGPVPYKPGTVVEYHRAAMDKGPPMTKAQIAAALAEGKRLASRPDPAPLSRKDPR
jgi:hypothetical protein